MKKLVFSVVMAVVATTWADMKFGTVDLMLLVKNHPNYDSNKTLLESTDKDYQKKLNAIKDEGEKLQEEGKKMAEQFRNPMLNATRKAELEKELTQLQQKLIGIEQRYRSEAVRTRQDLQDLEGRLLKTTTEDLRKRITKYAEEEGYDFIFDRNAAPFAKEQYDVTDFLLEAMGVNPKAAKGRNESK